MSTVNGQNQALQT